MADVTRSRAPRFFAFWSRKTLIKRVGDWIRRQPDGLEMKDLSDHLAQDIGLSTADLERHRIKLPSQTTHHPRG